MEGQINFAPFSGLSKDNRIEWAWCDDSTGSRRKHICQTYSGNATDPFFTFEQISFVLIFFSTKKQKYVEL